MTTISTDLRQTRESAKRIRYEEALPITATNVQDAIAQGLSLSTTVSITPVNFASSPYAPLSTDSYLLVDTSGGAVTINLPAAAARNALPIVVKDKTGNAVANPNTVTPHGAETIDGLANYLIDGAYGAATFIPQTGGYFVGP